MEQNQFMKLSLSIIIILLHFCIIGNTQTVVAIDSLDFYGFNLQSSEYIDYKLVSSADFEDEYLSISKFNNEIVYVSLIRHFVSGTEKPMIIRYDLTDKSYEEIIIDEIERPVAIDVDIFEEKIYWIDPGLNKLKRTNLDGSFSETILDDDIPEANYAFAVDGEFRRDIYMSYGDWRMFLIDMDSFSAAFFSIINDESPTPLQPLTAGAIGDIIVDEDEQYFYWLQNTWDSKPYIVKRETEVLAGGDEEVIVFSQNDQFHDLAYFDKRIYWTGNESILYSSSTDGSDLKQENEMDKEVRDFIVTSITTSIKDTELENLNSLVIYPNPSMNYISLEKDSKNYIQYSIVDANGVNYIANRYIRNDKIQIEDLPAGVYYLILKNKSGFSSTARFVKVKQ